jgi:hypothetical protein
MLYISTIVKFGQSCLVVVFRVKQKGILMAMSELSHLLNLIELEQQAAQSGFNGLAYGVSQHEFITARMENIGRFASRVEAIVEDKDEAARLIVERLK